MCNFAPVSSYEQWRQCGLAFGAAHQTQAPGYLQARCRPESLRLVRQAVRVEDPERSLLARLGAQVRRALPALDLARGLPGSPPGGGFSLQGRDSGQEQ